MIRKLFTIIGSLLLMLLLAVIILPFLIPIDEYRGDIMKIVEEKTGRKVSIDGDINFTLLPNIALEINDITVDNPKGFVSSYFAKIGNLQLKMALLPLLSKKIEVNDLAIDNADIYLEEAVGGKKNWEFTTAKIKKTASNDTNNSNNHNFALNVDTITINNTKANYIKPGLKVSTDKLNLDYGNNKAKLDLILKYAATNYNIDIKTTDTNSLFNDAKTPLKLSVKSPLISSNFSGKLGGLNISSGKFDIKLIGEIAAKVTGVGTANSRKFSANMKEASFGLLSIDNRLGVTATGDMVVNYASKKPHIKTTLSIPELNLDKLFPKKKKQESLAIISDAYAAEDWSHDVVNLSPLRVIDATANLSITKLIASGYNFDNFTSAMNLKRGNLNISSFKAGLLGGNISGNGAINDNGNWNKTIRISNIPFEKLAAPYMKNIAITGMTNGSVSLRSNGKSMYDWMHRLAGGGNITISNGQIKGFSLPKIFRKVIGLGEKIVKYDVNEQTKLKSIKTAFSIDNGVIKLREAKLRADRLKADASGSISLANKSLNLTLTPELIPQVKVAEGEPPVSGLMVPVIVKGSFDNINVKPDYSRTIGDILKDPKNIEKRLRNFKTEGKAIEDSLEPSKNIIKDNWKDLKNNKNPAALKNIFNELDKNGLKLF